MNKKGLICTVYDSKLGNCSNDGASAKFKSVVLIGEHIPEIFSPSDDVPAVELFINTAHGTLNVLSRDVVPYDKINYNARVQRVCAKPADHADKWYMHGGAFIYACDSRFPYENPIPLFDRCE